MQNDIAVTFGEDHVAVIEVRRGPNNFLDVSTLQDLVSTSNRLVSDEGCRAIVLCSEGKHFSAGANFASGGMGEDRVTMARMLYRVAREIFAVEVPIIAAVQGAAVGGGLGLACAADFRVAAATSRFHANFSSLGFHHGFALTVTLPRIVGPQHAADLLYTSRRITSAQAKELGLVDRVVRHGEERAEAVRWAREIAACAPLAVRAIKATLRAEVVAQVQGALEREITEQAKLWPTKDCAMGIAAAAACEMPIFTGS